MDEWLKANKPIDLRLKLRLTPHRYGAEYADYDEGGRDFFRLLRMIEHLPLCNLGWSKRGFRLWEQEAEYLADSRRLSDAAGYADDEGSIYMVDDGETLYGSNEVYYTFKYNWGIYATQLHAEFKRFRPEYNFTADHMIALIEAITRWKRPQHLEFGPSDYFQLHHPLDRARRGIRWIGWVPFALTPSDVPEAALVQEMNGGSLIATQMEFWQVFEHHPLYSKQAIERAQEVEIRLNLLGVLPTAVELDRGDWGQ
ncbi:immunity 52 family protein [Roseobacter weihaiensis]|uniref:immunity 52 family protein n=1 Tax=Roseobacter weihaiensis TaxID=2763262 RepID=UPI001D0B708B|nr:immunity 52 family protein [Roseobacter sp. H9]